MVLQTLYPLGDKYVKGVVLQAPPPDSQTKPPRLELLSRTTATDTGVDKLLFQLHLPKPGLVGCMRFHGEMLEWSLPPLKAFNGSLVSYNITLNLSNQWLEFQ